MIKRRPRRIKEDAEYRRLSKKFLAAHPYCQHFIMESGLDEGEVIRKNGFIYDPFPKGPLTKGHVGFHRMIEVPRSNQVHHRKGRGQWYLDVSTWMAVSQAGQDAIHRDPAGSYSKGYLLPRTPAHTDLSFNIP